MSAPVDDPDADPVTGPGPRISRPMALASWLLTAVCEELAKTRSGPVGVRLLSPSASPPPADWCCRTAEGLGMAWVRIVRRWTSTRFPAPDATPDARGPLAVELETGVYRCAATLDDSGLPPAPEEVTADAMAADADACALADAVGRLRWTHVRGMWVAAGPSGGCAGGTQTVTVSIGPGPIGR